MGFTSVGFFGDGVMVVGGIERGGGIRLDVQWCQWWWSAMSMIEAFGAGQVWCWTWWYWQVVGFFLYLI